MISVRPARPASDLPFFAPVGLSRQHGRAFAMQLGADAFTIERNGAPVLIAGRWVQPDHQEIWMMHSPSLADPFVLARALAIGRRDYLRAWNRPGPVMISWVLETNRAGQKLARLFGFESCGPHDDAPGYELFVFTDAKLVPLSRI
jgi:hypothetical protein